MDVVDVSDWLPAFDEPLGTKPKQIPQDRMPDAARSFAGALYSEIHRSLSHRLRTMDP